MTAMLITETGDTYRAMAADCRNRSAASFERCDTDGFLTQWANDVNARKYDLAAVLADNDGEAEFDALFDLDGNIVPARIVKTQFGPSWMVCDTFDGMRARHHLAVAWVSPLALTEKIDADGVSWFTPNKRSINAAARKGYRYGTIIAKAVVLTADSGEPYAAIRRDVRIEDAEVVEVI